MTSTVLQAALTLDASAAGAEKTKTETIMLTWATLQRNTAGTATTTILYFTRAVLKGAQTVGTTIVMGFQTVGTLLAETGSAAGMKAKTTTTTPSWDCR